MKNIILILLIFFGVESFGQQVKISEMTTFSGKADSSWVPVVINGTNYKTLGKNLVSGKLDSIYVKKTPGQKDSLFEVSGNIVRFISTISTSASPGIISVQTIAERDAIPDEQRYEGLFSYVSDSSKYYSLIGGIANINWEEFKGSELPEWIPDTVYAHSAAIEALKDSVNKVDSLNIFFGRPTPGNDTIKLITGDTEQYVIAPENKPIPDIPAGRILYGDTSGSGALSYSPLLRYAPDGYVSLLRELTGNARVGYAIQAHSNSRRAFFDYDDTTKIARVGTYASDGILRFATNNTTRGGFDADGRFYLTNAAMPIDTENSYTYVLAADGNRFVRVPFPSGGGGSGTVTSVGLSLPNIFSVSGSPVTGSGTLTATLANQTQWTVFARGSGTGAPSFQALNASHIPDLAASKITSGTFNVARLGTGTANDTKVLYGDGTWKDAPSGGGGSGTVSSGTQYRIGIYAANGTTISENAAITANRVIVSNSNGLPTHSSITTTQIGYLSGLSGNVESRLDDLETPEEISISVKTGSSADSLKLKVGGDSTMVGFFKTGSYTPTSSVQDNLDSYTIHGFSWTRIGNHVTVWGSVTVNTTSSGVAGLYLSFPPGLGTTLDSVHEVVGSGAINEITGVHAVDVTTNSLGGNYADVQWSTTDTSNNNVLHINFSYTIK